MTPAVEHASPDAPRISVPARPDTCRMFLAVVRHVVRTRLFPTASSERPSPVVTLTACCCLGTALWTHSERWAGAMQPPETGPCHVLCESCGGAGHAPSVQEDAAAWASNTASFESA